MKPALKPKSKKNTMTSSVSLKMSNLSKKESVEKSLENKVAKTSQVGQKSRLILRNVSFHITALDLSKDIKKWSDVDVDVDDINILTKSNGLRVGCVFVQCRNVVDASKVLKKLNGKEMKNRKVAVDWAVPKDKFQISFPKSNDDDRDEASNNVEEEDDEIKDDEDADEDEDEANDDDEVHHNNTDVVRRESGHDLNEHCTVFLRNLSFETTEDSLASYMEDNFGTVRFAKLVIDKDTDRPRGTAFVKFKDSEHAQECIRMGELELDGRRVYVNEALSKSDVTAVNKERREKEKKDSRNLHLAVEGLVREGTLAAEGVSAADMSKRSSLTKWKKNKLKDLSTFVSPVRLCVRNIPANMEDKELKQIFCRHSNKARITEAKVIRDMRKLDDKGKGVSKGYGFVTFMEHEAALSALREVNNNPKVFTVSSRPIVEFSIESRKALKARDLRLQKSILNNPNLDETEKQRRVKEGLKHLETVKKLNKKKKNLKEESSENSDNKEDGKRESFMGSLSKSSRTSLPSHTGPKIRHDATKRKISRRDLKKQEQRAKKKGKKRTLVEENTFNDRSDVQIDNLTNASQLEVKKRKLSKSEKRKKKEANDEKQFNKMVASYTNKLSARTSQDNEPKSKVKWFD